MFTPLKPRFRDFFHQDLVNNLTIRSCQGSVQLYKHHIITECVMYSCDMCLEFQRKSDGLLTSDWIDHITKETGEALKAILPNDFNDSDINVAIEKVQQLMRFPASALQEEIDRYYNRISN